jgi:hypothetical protein
MGGDNEDDRAGGIAQANGSTDFVPLSSTDASNFPGTGVCMLTATGTGSVNEIVPFIKSGNDLVLQIASSNSIATDAVVYNGFQTFINQSATATGQAQCIGEDDVWLMLGLHGGFAMSNLLQLEGTATFDFTFDAIDWEVDSASIAAGSFDSTSQLATNEDMEVHWQSYGTSTRNAIACSDLQINPNIIWTPHRCRGASDTEHADRVNMTGGAANGNAITGQFTVDAAAAYQTDFAALTEKQLLVTFGRTPGSSWAIWLPRVVITSVPSPGAHMEQSARTVQFEAMGVSSDGGYNARSPMHIVRL